MTKLPKLPADYRKFLKTHDRATEYRYRHSPNQFKTMLEMKLKIKMASRMRWSA